MLNKNASELLLLKLALDMLNNAVEKHNYVAFSLDTRFFCHHRRR